MTYNGHRALAAAVITRAIKDAHAHFDEKSMGCERRIKIRQDALAFLKPENEMFEMCCDAIDYDPQALIEAIKRRGKLFVQGIPNDRRSA